MAKGQQAQGAPALKPSFAADWQRQASEVAQAAHGTGKHEEATPGLKPATRVMPSKAPVCARRHACWVGVCKAACVSSRLPRKKHAERRRHHGCRPSICGKVAVNEWPQSATNLRRMTARQPSWRV